MKALTIPKLELQASLLASRLRKEVQCALTMKIDKVFMWTDSTTVLQWIHSIEKQPVFVANRVAEILELTTTDEWNYVQSCDNPADAGTGGLSATVLSNSIWLKGPDFLKTLIGPLGRRNTRRSKLNNGLTFLVTESYSLEARPFSTPMLASTHQLSSGRSTALMRNSCVLPLTSCVFYQRTRLTAPLQVPLLTRVSSKMLK